MTYRIYFPQTFFECPIWWQNLVRKLNNSSLINKFIIDNSLHVQFIYVNHKYPLIHYIEFESYNHFMIFLLKI